MKAVRFRRRVSIGIGTLLAIAASWSALRLHATSSFAVTPGTTQVARQGHAATLLHDGRVLIAGGFASMFAPMSDAAELYDPTTQTFLPLPNMLNPRTLPVAALLQDGRVLIVSSALTPQAELFDPVLGTFTAAGAMHATRVGCTATTLDDGRVLVAGGRDGTTGTPLTSSEIYDPAAGTFQLVQSLTGARSDHTATLLDTGEVLVVGGFTTYPNAVALAELFHPDTNTWTLAGAPIVPRGDHVAEKLADGRVLIAAGSAGADVMLAEVYDPATHLFSPSGSLATGRTFAASTLLPNGKVLIAGGRNANITELATTEFFDPETGQFNAGPNMTIVRDSFRATSLQSGSVLVTGARPGTKIAELLTFTGETPYLSWKNPAPIAQGTLLGPAQLNARAPVPGTYVYSPPAGTSLPPGNAQSLTVTFHPDDSAQYTTATKTVSIDVTSQNPFITWHNPSAILQGTPLGGAQLNATANMPGAFVYTPPAGTILPAGLGQPLAVTFTPADPNFAPVSTGVIIDVYPSSAHFSGQVIDAVTGLPIQNASVATYNAGGANVTSAATDASGLYATSELSFGKYFAKASAGPGYVDQLYNQINCIAGCAATSGTPISIPANCIAGCNVSGGAGVTVPIGCVSGCNVTSGTAVTSGVTVALSPTNINFTLLSRGAIAGDVKDDGNHPLAGITVSIHDIGGAVMRTVTTNSAGHYVVSGLPTASYFAHTTNAAGYGDVLYDGFPCAAGCNVTTGTPITTAIGYVSQANFVLPANTPPGSNVVASPTDPVSSETATVQFATVTNAGQTTLTVSNTGPDVPAGFTLGSPLVFFDVATTATYTAPVTTCFSYNGISFSDPARIRLLHFEGGAWLDVTVSVDQMNQIVCGTTTSLSPFVIAQVQPQTPTITWANPADIVFGTALGPTQLNATASTEGTFDYAPPAGTVLNVGSHTLSVTFTPADTVHFTNATASVSLTVTPAAQVPPVVTFTSAPASAAYGTSFDVMSSTNASTQPVITAAGSCVVSGATVTMTSGTGICDLTATWAADPNYLGATAHQATTARRATPTVTFTGAPASAVIGSTFDVSTTTSASTAAVLTATGSCSLAGATATMTIGAGTCHLKAAWPADGNYRAATATQSTTATKHTPVVTWSTPDPISYGTALDGTQLDATADVPGTFVYTPAAGKVLAGGAHTLTVKFTPADTDSYDKADATVVLTVNPAATTITWDPLTPIVYGDDLGPKQLNAKASAGGTYVYSPPSGTVLPVGVNVISVTFTPSNSANYSGSSASVNITVTPATPKITWHKPNAITYGTVLDSTQLNATANVTGTFDY